MKTTYFEVWNEMHINIGDRIVYTDRDGAQLNGEVVDIFKNNSKEITDYFVELDSGQYVNEKPNYPNWFKRDKLVLIS